MGLLFGYLAAAVIIAGFVVILSKRRILAVLSGCLDMVFVVLSVQGLRDMMLASGKILTPELFGLGNYKLVVVVYAAMFAIGAVYVLIGTYGIVKNRSQKLDARTART